MGDFGLFGKNTLYNESKQGAIYVMALPLI
jgi:hypothetical protein